MNSKFDTKRLPFAPLPISEYYVLAVLAQRNYGPYDLRIVIKQESSGSVIISGGHMSRVLARLLADGYIGEDYKIDRVMPYKLTENGKRRLREELDKHRRAAFIAEKNLD